MPRVFKLKKASMLKAPVVPLAEEAQEAPVPPLTKEAPKKVVRLKKAVTKPQVEEVSEAPKAPVAPVVPVAPVAPLAPVAPDTHDEGNERDPWEEQVIRALFPALLGKSLVVITELPPIKRKMPRSSTPLPRYDRPDGSSDKMSL